jgi:hypothetical protein
MEDVLEVYTQPYDPQRPVVCMDETNKQLTAEVREPLPPIPGHQERYDYEYQRQGVADLFMFFEPLKGQRHVQVTEHRTRKEWAETMRMLAEVWYPQAEQIVVVLDNLNTHTPAAFYEEFTPAEARRKVVKVHWQFKTADARIKLKHLYPKIQD